MWKNETYAEVVRMLAFLFIFDKNRCFLVILITV